MVKLWVLVYGFLSVVQNCFLHNVTVMRKEAGTPELHVSHIFCVYVLTVH